MSEEDTDHTKILVTLLCFLIVISGKHVTGEYSLDTDKQVLLQLKSFLEDQNPVSVYQFKYTLWNSSDQSPCKWAGITCDNTTNRAIGIDLSSCNIAGNIFRNFSALTALSHLDLSENTLGGIVPDDLGHCRTLRFLNLSHNIITGKLNLTGLENLEVLDLSLNRIRVNVRLIIPGNCNSLVVANVSNNNLTGEVGDAFANCLNLRFLDLSENGLNGELWPGIDRMVELSLSGNNFSGTVPSRIFTEACSLRILDLSENEFFGLFPGEISNCTSLEELTLWGNMFTGPIPKEIGLLHNVRALDLGNNGFSREIPETLTTLSNLTFLDLSRNGFGENVQTVFGQLTQVRSLLLHENSYTGGIDSSGILDLPNISWLDLSYNYFSGPLPVRISQMKSLTFLVLAYNRFTGTIPFEYGNNLTGLQALDLSFNGLTGSIPLSLGNLSSLLWLMLANNSLSGEFPSELGSCRSLLWLNIANNRLSGSLPSLLTSIGSNAMPTFTYNRENDRTSPGPGECLAMMRWIPVDYPPFSFVYDLLSRKKCRSLWDKLLKGYGLFSVCLPGSIIRTTQISGYLQLSGNRFSGNLPLGLGKMLDFSMLHLGENYFSGKIPPDIGQLPLLVLNVSRNVFSGEIPSSIGNIKCLQELDLSYNNFSGVFPSTTNNLDDLNKFNVSYNPYISGVIPSTGQLATFDKWSFLGDPLLRLPPFIANATDDSTVSENTKYKKAKDIGASLAIMCLILATLVFGVFTLLVCIVFKGPEDSKGYLLEARSKDIALFVTTSSGGSLPPDDIIKVIRMDKTAFTHSDILKATRRFSEDRIIGRGGSGLVYKGTLPDGREVAVKKLQTEGSEGEREFRAEMEVLSSNNSNWPHPNLVQLYGWCLNGSEKLLVYEYMEGGSLEDLITDRMRLNPRRRIEVAIDVARALVYLHHECSQSIVHRDVKASNVLLDRNGRARVTDFGLARIVETGGSHVSTMVAGTVGYVAPEYGQTWHATTKGDVYSYGVLAMELATGRRAVDGGEECLVEWAKRVGDGAVPAALSVSGLGDGSEKMRELLRVGLWCTNESPHLRPDMKEVLAVLFKISCSFTTSSASSSSSARSE